jgi:hypothetical protein
MAHGLIGGNHRIDHRDDRNDVTNLLTRGEIYILTIWEIPSDVLLTVLIHKT